MPRLAVSSRTRARTRDALEVVAAAAALVVCVATSRPLPPPEMLEDEGETADPVVELEAAAVLHNALEQPVVVRLSTLRAGVDLDCPRILDPGALLSQGLFTSPQTWEVPPSMTIPLPADPSRGCNAVWIESASFETRVMFWNAGELQWRVWDQEAPAEGDGALTIVPEGTDEGAGESAAAELVSAQGRLWTPALEPRPAEACAPAPAGERLEWSDPAPNGQVRILSVDHGLDGCSSITFEQGDETLAPWFLCASAAAWPFEEGETIDIQPLYSAGLEGVTLSAPGFEQREGAQLLLARGSEVPRLAGLTGTVVGDADCALDVEPACGTVTLAGALELRDEAGLVVEVSPRTGARELQTPEGRAARVEVSVSAERLVLDPECAPGPDVLGPDFAAVVTTW